MNRARRLFSKLNDDRGEALPFAILGGVITPLVILIGVPAVIQNFLDTTAGHLTAWAAGLIAARTLWKSFFKPAKDAFETVMGLDIRARRLEVNQHRMHKRAGRIEEHLQIPPSPELEPVGEHDPIPSEDYLPTRVMS